jgi:hypothetical protein
VSSPTARSLELLRREGWTAGVVERRLPRCFITVDLFNAFDIVAIRPDVPGVFAVQATGDNGGNHAARVRKLIAEAAVRTWLAAGNRAEVWSWRKAGNRWQCRRQAVTLADLPTITQANPVETVPATAEPQET